MSPILFNLVIDGLLKRLPQEIGFAMVASTDNALDFVDDIVLSSSTPRGLQKLLDSTCEYISRCGLTLNAAKSFCLGIKGQPKQNKAVVEGPEFRIIKTSLLSVD